MHISLFGSAKDNVPVAAEITWEALVAKLSVFAPRSVKGGECWSPVRYTAGVTRGNKGVEEISLLVFDLDHVSQQEVDSVRASLDVAAVMHTTFSDTPESRSFRVVIPLADSVKPDLFTKMRKQVAEQYGIPSDPATNDLARIFFLPSKKDGAIPEFYEFKGNMFSYSDTVVTEQLGQNAISSRLYNVTNPESRKLAKIIADGECLATSNRDAAMQRAASLLAFVFPELNVTSLREIAKQSITKMPSDNPLEYELDKFSKKLHRAKNRKGKIDTEQRAIGDALIPQPSSVAKYDIESVREFAEQNRCTEAEFMKRWIIQVESSYYVFVDGEYKYPVSEKVVALSLDRDLASSPAVLRYLDPKTGKSRKLTLPEIMEKYGTAARHIMADMTIQRSYYDANTQTFHEATCPLREFNPVCHGDVSTWLRLLGGNAAEKLLDWLACVTDLSKQSAALLLEGDSGSGKGLLASGIARLWSKSAPTSFDVLISDWTSYLAQCPFVFADEGLPKRKDYSLGDELRRWTGSQEHKLTRKYMPDASMRGSIRLMLASNNNHILSGFDELGEQDRVALAQRLVYIKIADGKARAMLESLSHSERELWCEKKIPEMLTWLKMYRTVTPGKRFVVEGTETDMHTKLSIGAGLTPELFEILAAEILSINTPTMRDSFESSLKYGNGRLLVTNAFFKRAGVWDKHCSRATPRSIQIYRAVENVSSGTVTENNVMYNIICLPIFESWASSYLGCDKDKLLDRIMK